MLFVEQLILTSTSLASVEVLGAAKIKAYAPHMKDGIRHLLSHFFLFLFLFFFLLYFTLQSCVGFAIHQQESAMDVQIFK